MTPTLFPTISPSANGSCWRRFQRAAELSRVLDETAASYEELQATHQAALEELNALKRWIYGRRTEKLVEGEGQRHLFDLESSSTTAPPLEPTPEPPRPAARAPSPRTRPRQAAALSARARSERSGQAVLRLRSGQGPHRPGREPDSGVRPGEARSARPRATQVRLPVLQRRRGEPAAAERPIARGIAGPGLIAQIVVAKFGEISVCKEKLCLR